MSERHEPGSSRRSMHRCDLGAMRITGSLVVCMIAGGFTAATLIVNPDAPSRSTPVVASPAGTLEIAIADFAFSSLTATPGAAVTVANRDDFEHTLSAEDGSFDTGLLAGSSSSSIVAPSAPGVYTFFCQVHPSMSGQLTVAG
jgi:plastocyanin